MKRRVFRSKSQKKKSYWKTKKSLLHSNRRYYFCGWDWYRGSQTKSIGTHLPCYIFYIDFITLSKTYSNQTGRRSGFSSPFGIDYLSHKSEVLKNSPRQFNPFVTWPSLLLSFWVNASNDTYHGFNNTFFNSANVTFPDKRNFIFILLVAYHNYMFYPWEIFPRWH